MKYDSKYYDPHPTDPEKVILNLVRYAEDHPNKIINGENAHEEFNRVAKEQPAVSMLGFYESWGGPYKYCREEEPEGGGPMRIVIRQATAAQRAYGKGH